MWFPSFPKQESGSSRGLLMGNSFLKTCLRQNVYISYLMSVTIQFNFTVLFAYYNILSQSQYDLGSLL